MKKFSILLILGAALSGIVSCDLTTVPEDSITPDRYFNSAVSLEQWLNNCYTQFDGYSIMEIEADDMLDQGFTAFFSGSRLPSTESWSWSMLRRINYFLEHSDICPDKEAVAYYNALAKFHRAYFYFEKVKRYGDIMWYDKVIGSTDNDLLYKARDDRGFVVDKMLEDLDEAIAGLAGTPKNERSTNVTEWVALALKARITLFEGTFRKYRGMADADKYLEACADACDKIIRSGRFSLYNTGDTPYRDIFSMDPVPAGETILARSYNAGLNFYHSFTRDMLGTRTGLTWRFVTHYLTKTGDRITDLPGYNSQSFAESFNNRDPRMAQTIWGPGARDYTGHNLSEAFNMTALTGYYPLKFQTDVVNNTNRDEDIMLIRYPEILLAYAEAKAELGQLEQDDVEVSINVIRERAGMPKFNKDYAKSNPDELLSGYYPNVKLIHPSDYGLILEIRRERTVELVMEGHRQWDLIRWKEGPAIDNSKNPFYGVYLGGPGIFDLDGDGIKDFEIYTTAKSGTVSKTFKLDEEIFLSDDGHVIAFKDNRFVFDENRDYLWPIPAAQRALCGGVLTQNPGWDDGLTF